MWKEIGFILGLLIVIEIGYRLFDYILYRLNNMPGKMDEEE
tara:strand:+ start:1937 stop:2059 length:123 start_codon:yes stop_codon:yes gene_type:complete